MALLCLNFNRVKDVIFPPVDAHSGNVRDKGIEDTEETTSEDEVKKKSTDEKKLGFETER